MRYWLRIEHERVDFATPIAIQDRASLLASRELEQFLLGAYFGLAALIVVVAAANAMAYRDRNFGVYAVYVATLAAGQVAYLGVGAQHVWDHWLKWNEVATFLLPGVSRPPRSGSPAPSRSRRGSRRRWTCWCGA